MRDEAVKINPSAITNSIASFYHYDGKNIPFRDNHFDKIVSIKLTPYIFGLTPRYLLMKYTGFYEL
ncbi:hypothetical protein [Aquimarina pacifica]|uniref:hypothetical protein n=1 Tax=Aquimarina pacifica TaxID=1296415 RepID=UPI0004718111|nr:hypothetical protein [Aquimarina pacifica]